MDKACEKCGLPKELCVCETIAKEKEKVKVSSVRRRYGKQITVINGIGKGIDIKKVLKELKQSLACGGTLKGNTIELQGGHMEKIKNILKRLGFTEDQIVVE